MDNQGHTEGATATETPAAAKEPVTAVIVREVRPGKQEAFEEWIKEVNAVRSGFDGHEGTTVVRPRDHAHPEYVLILRFRDCEAMMCWSKSPELAALLKKAEPIAVTRERQEQTGLETWFTLPGRETPKPPPQYKMAITAWLAIFPLVLALSYALSPVLGAQALPVRILVSTLILTPVMTWVAMPRLTRLLWPWLYPGVPKTP